MTLRLPETMALPPYSGSFSLYDESTLLGQVTKLAFLGSAVDATISGTSGYITVTAGPGGGGGSAGIMGWDDGVPLGTGTILDARNRLTMTRSGSVLTLDADPFTGPFPPEVIGVYGIDDGIPVGTGTSLDAGNFLSLTLSGTRLRLDAVLPPEPAEQIGIWGLDHGIPQGTGTSLDAGDFLRLTISGTRLRADVLMPPAPAELIGVYGIDDGIPVGTGTSLDAGNFLSLTLSGTRLRLDAVLPPEPQEQIGIMAWDEGVPLGTGVILNAVGAGVTLSRSGTVIELNIPGGSGPGGSAGIGIYGLDDGAPIGTGSWLDARQGLTLTRSGTVLTLDAPLFTGPFPQPVLGVMGWDDGVPVGTGTTLDAGYGVHLTLSGSVLLAEAETPVTGSIVFMGFDPAPNGVPSPYFSSSRIAFRGSGIALSEITGGSFPWRPHAILTITEKLAVRAGGTGTRKVDGLDFIDPLSIKFSGTIDRNFGEVFLRPPVTGSFVAASEGTILGSAKILNVAGSRAAFTLSGSYATLTISPDPQPVFGIMSWDEGVPVGTGSILNAVGAGITLSRSGTVIELNVPGGGSVNPPVTGTAVVYDESTLLGSFAELRFIGSWVDVSNSGSYAAIGIPARPLASLTDVSIVGLVGGDALVFSAGSSRWINVPQDALTTASGSITIADEGAILGGIRILDARGSRVSLLRSGVYGTLLLSPDPVDNIGVYGLDDGIPIGTGSSLDAGNFLSLTLSGTRLRLDAILPPEPQEQIGVMAWDDGVPRGTGTILDARNRLTLTRSGSVLTLDADLFTGPFPQPVFGVMAWDEGIPLGTGVILNAVGAGITLSRSGTVIELNVPGGGAASPPITGSVVFSDEGAILGSITQLDVRGARLVGSRSGIYGTIESTPEPAEQIGIWGLDHGVPQGTGTSLDSGYGIALTVSGTRILLRAETPVTGSIIIAEDGGVLGSSPRLDFRESILATFSGGYGLLDVKLRPQGVDQQPATFTFPNVVVPGLMGIGTAAPAQRLDVRGGIVVYGSGTVPAYFSQGVGNNLQLTTNVDPISNVISDVAKAQWKQVLGAVADSFTVRRSPPSAVYTETILFTLNNSGSMVIPGGMQVGSPSGGDKGIGSMNVGSGYFFNGVPFPSVPLTGTINVRTAGATGYGASEAGVEIERLQFIGAVGRSGSYAGNRIELQIIITGGYPVDYQPETYSFHQGRTTGLSMMMPAAYPNSSNAYASGSIPHSRMIFTPFLPYSDCSVLGIGFRTVTTISGSVGRVSLVADFGDNLPNASSGGLIAEANFVLSTGTGWQYAALTGSITSSRIALVAGRQYWMGFEVGPSGTTGPSVVQWALGTLQPSMWGPDGFLNAAIPPDSPSIPLLQNRPIVGAFLNKSYITISGSANPSASYLNAQLPIPAVLLAIKRHTN